MHKEISDFLVLGLVIEGKFHAFIDFIEVKRHNSDFTVERNELQKFEDERGKHFLNWKVVNLGVTSNGMYGSLDFSSIKSNK